ncbi:MAG: DUF3368 domain-containing protein [Blastocatellia bacterium AA13]|nr:MAG: DUF3368 domain-containing protein [Blastocatellia bacterium AA13]
MREVISDTSPLQYLFQIGLLDLLNKLYAKVIVPEAVASEIKVGLASRVMLPELTSLSWIRIREASQRALLPIAPGLGPGEREALALAVEAPGSLVLLDDGLARRHARLLKVKFTGTLGVLLKAKSLGHLASITPVMDRLDGLGFRLDTKTRAAILEIAKESE